MVTEAATKLKNEMEQNKNNPYIQVIGEFLINHINQNPGQAEKVLNQDKTIGKSFSEMRKVAEKKKVGNCAVLTDQEGFEIVLKYFEMDTKGPIAVKAHEAAPDTKTVDFDVKLEDFI